MLNKKHGQRSKLQYPFIFITIPLMGLSCFTTTVSYYQPSPPRIKTTNNTYHITHWKCMHTKKDFYFYFYFFLSIKPKPIDLFSDSSIGKWFRVQIKVTQHYQKQPHTVDDLEKPMSGSSFLHIFNIQKWGERLRELS